MIQPKPKPQTPEEPEPIARTVEKSLALLVQITDRQDQLFFGMLNLERHVQKIDAGFVLTSFGQAVSFKVQTHAMFEGINDLIDTFKLTCSPNRTPHESTAE